MSIPPVLPNAIFLNIPYDDRFRRQYLAYCRWVISTGSSTEGYPRDSRWRCLDRILALIQSCRYSIHDLSRVEIDRKPPPTPRFNMPCELGLTITWQKLNPSRHTWFVFESRRRRLQKSLSDLDGSDPNILGATVEGIMRELCNAFVRRRGEP